MKVILLENIDKVGKIGDVVEVKDGFGRNYLLPRNRAMAFSDNAIKFIEKKKKTEKTRYAKEVEINKALAEKISAASCTVKVQAGEDDKLYGSVTSIDIQNALEQENIIVDKKKISIDEPIKKLGVYSVTIKLLPEVEAVLKVWVVRS